MARKINDYIAEKNKGIALDISFHDLVELRNLGFNDAEIARELGVPKSHVNKLVSQYDKYF